MICIANQTVPVLMLRINADCWQRKRYQLRFDVSCAVLNEPTITHYIAFLDSSMVEHSAVNRVVVGSSPTRGAFFYTRPHGQAVKTSPFHGGYRGSNPLGVTLLPACIGERLIRTFSSVG